MCLLGEGRIKRVQWEVLAYLYAWITKTIHPGCRIVGSHTRWELTTWADFQLCLHRLLMSTGCKSSHNGFLDVSRSNSGLSISGCIGQLSCLTIFSTSLSVAAFLRRPTDRNLHTRVSFERTHKGVIRTTLSDLAKYSMKERIARPLWDSWVSCTVWYLPITLLSITCKASLIFFREFQLISFSDRVLLYAAYTSN